MFTFEVPPFSQDWVACLLKKMLFLEQYAIEEWSIASYIAYYKYTMQGRWNVKGRGNWSHLFLTDAFINSIPITGAD